MADTLNFFDDFADLFNNDEKETVKKETNKDENTVPTNDNPLNSLLIDALNDTKTEIGEIGEIDNELFNDNTSNGDSPKISSNDSNDDLLDNKDNIQNNDKANSASDEFTSNSNDEDEEDDKQEDSEEDKPITNLLGEEVEDKKKNKSSKNTTKKKEKTPKEKTQDECKKYNKIIIKYSGLEIMTIDSKEEIKNINLDNIKEKLITEFNFGELNDDLLWRLVPSRTEGEAFLQPYNKMMPKG